MPPRRVYTFGHSLRSLADTIVILKGFGVEVVADVRSIPSSRRNPGFNRATLPGNLAQAEIGYTHFGDLGGFRSPRPESGNLGWKNDTFRGFADYMDTPEFNSALQGLLELTMIETVAMMCAEALPWRCHRFLLADALTVRGYSVIHILGPGESQTHNLTPFANFEGARLTYPPPD